MISFSIPGKISSKTNARPRHWRRRHQASANQRAHGKYSTLVAFRMAARAEIAAAKSVEEVSAVVPKDAPAMLTALAPGQSILVRMIRQAPRALDSDNIAEAFKSLRDGIADAFGVADNHPRIYWLPDQERAKVPAVRVEISAVSVEELLQALAAPILAKHGRKPATP